MREHCAGLQQVATAGVVLGVIDLLKWDGWTKDSKDYLRQCGDELDVRSLVVKYTEVIETFQARIDNKLMEHHKDDLELLRIMQEDYERDRVPKAMPE